jgi:peptidoglycan/xylan/chitin deacetylase (PgdA/CDA1 family)
MDLDRTIDTLCEAVLQPPRQTWFGGVRCHGDRASQRIALTFDDGPNSPSTEWMLDTLDRLDIPATFFCIGQQVNRFPETVDRAHRAGHEIANHSMHHSRAASLAVGKVDHIVDAQDAIRSITGYSPRWYRPPHGWTTPWELWRARRLGLNIVGWDVDAEDWRVPETASRDVANLVLSKARPGSIVLMHDATSHVGRSDRAQSAAAVEIIVKQMQDTGLEFVTVSSLFGQSALPVQPSVAECERPNLSSQHR